MRRSTMMKKHPLNHVTPPQKSINYTHEQTMRINAKTTFTPFVSLITLYFVPHYVQINPAGPTALINMAFLLMRILSRIFTTKVSELAYPKYAILASKIEAVNTGEWENLDTCSSKGMPNIRGSRSVGVGLLIWCPGMDVEIL